MPKCIHWGSTHLRPTVQSSRWVNSPSDIEKPWKNHSDDHHQRRQRRGESLTLMTHHLVFQSIYTIQHVVWNHKCFRLWLDECMCCMRLQKYVASNRQCCYHENTIMCMNTLASHWSGTFLPLGWLGVISQVPGSLDGAISTISWATSRQWNRNSTCSSSCKMHGFTMGSFNQIPPARLHEFLAIKFMSRTPRARHNWPRVARTQIWSSVPHVFWKDKTSWKILPRKHHVELGL